MHRFRVLLCISPVSLHNCWVKWWHLSKGFSKMNRVTRRCWLLPVPLVSHPHSQHQSAVFYSALKSLPHTLPCVIIGVVSLLPFVERLCFVCWLYGSRKPTQWEPCSRRISHQTFHLIHKSCLCLHCWGKPSNQTQFSTLPYVWF